MTSSSTYPVIKGTLVSTENYTWNTADTLGRGASAMVFLGRHKVRGSYVAVKVFHDHVHAGYKSEDLRELELLKELKHSNIIQLLAIEKMVSNMKQVLVVEYCEGGSLHHMLDQPPYCYGLTEDEFLLVLFHVCDGMKYLQEKKVIHRDIKPGNIMRSITEDGFSIYKLTDFGAARNLHEDESFQSLYGTEEYLHPGMYERAVLKLPNSQLFDAKVDLWSLGVTFFHTATGQLPFQPYGGRSNRNTMFEIITQKESGVISGVQSFEHGPIQWKRDLPESSPLSSGLKSIVIPLLSGLMEPDSSKMISYQSLFRMVHNIRQKVVIHVFHYNKSEDLRIYAEPNITFTGLRDQIAYLTDIQASDQILLVGGKALDEVIDPNCLLQDYPPHLLVDKIYLFQREMTEAHRIPKPEIPTFPDFMPFSSDMDADARIAHGCSARGELIKRNLEKVSQQQERLINGLFYLRVYVESRLMATKVSHESLKQLMAECKVHIATFFDIVKLLRDAWGDKKTSRDFRFLNEVLNDSVIRQVHEKASDRMVEIEQYRDMLVKKLEDIKNYASKFTAGCPEEKCLKKIQHHMSVISGVHSRFRRDKTVKHQMTNHDENIHGFERQKLQEHCVTMKSIFTDHCLPQLERVYKNSIHICESLTKCLSRVAKIEKNIASVLNCQTLLSDKLFKFRVSCTTDLRTYLKDSGFSTGMSSESLTAKRDHMEAPETGESASSAYISGARSLGSGELVEDVETTKADGMMSLSQNASMLKEKLESVLDILDENYSILVRFYLRNGCTKGDKCAFRHTRIGPTESDAFRDTRSGPTESDVVCKYYQVGQCGFGSNCKFSHGKTVKHKDSPHGQMTNQTFENGQVSKFAAKEFPSHMVTLKKSNYGKGVQESESARTKKEFEQKWVAAQDFVPGKKFHGPVPSTYANAVQPNKDSSLAADDESDLSSLVSENYLLCPYFEQSGHCPFESTCQYAHGFMCDFCGLPKLHPLDEVQRDKHVKECIAEHEKQMEHAFAVQASQEKECGICLENVLEKENSHASASSKRFGILENCNHCFCLSCIRTWRHNKSDVIQTQRTCPTCRTHSDFVTPSKFWVESPEEKKKLIEDYKKAMSTKACQYFKLGKGECPFNNRCFYQHALEDGSIVHENIVRRRRRLNADGERGLEEDYSLWDYITRREEDGLLPLDAQLSLVLLGIFQDSDDDDDNNNSFGLRYDFLNGDFIFTDSDLETDSD